MSNLIPLLSGTGVALVTPFTSSKTIDEPALARVIEHVLAGGVEYVVTLGNNRRNAYIIKRRESPHRATHHRSS